MQIHCEIISIDEENEIAIINAHFPDKHGKDTPKMMVITGDSLQRSDSNE
ncbi:hypothetical protein [Terribacillus saccharophilus]|nr:hypothetical protein [Terribacillus saccharophilus]